MSSSSAGSDSLAHSQTSPAIPPSITGSPGMASATEGVERTRKEKVKALLENYRQTERPVVDQATECDKLKAGQSLETHIADTSSTAPLSPDSLGIAAPTTSPSSEPEVGQVGEDSSRPKRSHAEMAGPSPYDIWASRKVARLSEPLSSTQDLRDHVVAGPSDCQTPKKTKRSHRTSAGPDGEDDEDLPKKRKMAREVGAKGYSSATELVQEPAVLDPAVFSRSSLDVEAPECAISSQEKLDITTTPPQVPREPRPTTARTPSQPQPKSYLHTLPGELRNRIYTSAGFCSARLDLTTLKEPHLIVAYPDLKDELLSVMLSDNKLRVPVYSDFRINVAEAATHKQKPSRVGSFEVGTIAVNADNWVMKIDRGFVAIKHIGMRILEAPRPGIRQNDQPKLICDFFLNVRVEKGRKTTVSHKTMMTASTATRIFPKDG